MFLTDERNAGLMGGRLGRFGPLAKGGPPAVMVPWTLGDIPAEYRTEGGLWEAKNSQVTGASITAIPDTFGARRLVQPTAANQPTLATTNGFPAIVWPNAVNDLYLESETEFTPAFWVVVAMYRNGTETAWEKSQYINLLNSHGYADTISNGKIEANGTGGSWNVNGWSGGTDAKNARASTSIALPFNMDISEMRPTGAGVGVRGPWGVGRSAHVNGRGWQGKVWMAMALGIEPTGDLLARIQGRIAWDYGLQAKLPDGHPYKLKEPMKEQAKIIVTNGTVTPFSRDGVDYVEVLWQQSGGFTLHRDITSSLALGAGGGSGGAYGESGGGSAGQVVVKQSEALTSGTYTVQIGAGGASANGVSGNNGSTSSLSRGNPLYTAVGGMGGAGSQGDGRNGYLGSGGGGGPTSAGETSPSVTAGGVGTLHSGGTGIKSSTSTDRSGGGGAGMGGPGGNSSPGWGGAGGPGIWLDWIASPRGVAGGGGGGSKVSADQIGKATDGGTDGALLNSTTSNATFSGGSGGGGNGVAPTSGKGGDGFMFLVVRADQVKVEISS